MMTHFPDGTPIPMKYFWCGEDVADMSREKLLEIIMHLARELEHAHDAHMRSLDLWRALREAGRA